MTNEELLVAKVAAKLAGHYVARYKVRGFQPYYDFVEVLGESTTDPVTGRRYLQVRWLNEYDNVGTIASEALEDV